jgi:hypothetical protein
MVRRIVLAIAFVAAFGVVSVGMSKEASAHGPYGPRGGISLGGYTGYSNFGMYQSGYQSAAIRMGSYTPVYNNGFYGYPNVGPAYYYNNGGYYGGGYGVNNVIVIGF